VYAIWAFWALNCFINTIMFLNLLIAEVNNTYQRVMSESTAIDFSVMAELNFVYAKYWRSYDWARFFWETVSGTKLTQQHDVVMFTRPAKDIDGKPKSFSSIIMKTIRAESQRARDALAANSHEVVRLKRTVHGVDKIMKDMKAQVFGLKKEVEKIKGNFRVK